MKPAIKTLVLSISIIANTHFAYAQTASILPPAVTTFNDQNGKPLTGGKVYHYVPGTTTPKTTWQDSGETIPNSQPVVLDASGRAKILGDGSYRQRVLDRNGNLIWDANTSSTGSGGGGGGGTGTVGDGDAVGTVKAWAGFAAPSQYAFAYGQEFTRASFPELLAAVSSQQSVSCTSGNPVLSGLSSTENLPVGAPIESTCLNAGATIASKTSSTVTASNNAIISTTTVATFFPWGNGDGSTTFNAPDLRGRTIAGRDNMGGVAAARLTTAYFANADAMGATGGSESKTIAQNQLPNVVPTFTGNAPGSVALSGPIIAIPGAGGIGNGAGSFNPLAANNWSVTLPTPTGTISSINGNVTQVPLSVVQPTITTNYIIKILPDTNPNSYFGVASLGGMYGVIACGPGVTCVGNSISTISSAPVYSNVSGVPANTFLGNNTGSTANIMALTIPQATDALNTFTPSLKGLVPSSGGGTTNFLRADGIFTSPPSASLFTSSTAGTVPASGGGTSNYMRADGTWSSPPSSSLFTSSTSGTVPASGGGTANFMRADGSWSVPPGTGGGGGLGPIGARNLLANNTGGSAIPTGVSSSDFWDGFCSTVIGNIWVRTTGGWGCLSLGYANPVWWGADATGSADSASAISSALATNLPVKFPSGTFTVNSKISYTIPNGHYCFCVSGASGNSTTLNWPNANGGFEVTMSTWINNFDVRKMRLTTSQTDSGNAISITNASAGVGAVWNVIEDILATGDDFVGVAGTHSWHIGLYLHNVWDTSVHRYNFYGQYQSSGGSGIGIGMYYEGDSASSSYAVGLNVADSSFNYAGVGVLLGGWWQGVIFNMINCGANVGQACIRQLSGVGGVLASLTISNSQMNTGGNQIDLGTPINSLFVNNSSITCYSDNCIGIRTEGSSGVMISNNFFNLARAASGTSGIVTNGPNTTVVGNVFTGVNSGVYLGPSSNNTTVGLNSYTGVTNKIINSGSGNSVGTASTGNMTGVVP